MAPSPLHFGTSPGSRPGKDGVLGSKGPEHPRPCCQCQKESKRSLLRHGASIRKCPLRPERSKPKSSEGLASMPPRTRVLRQQTVSASNRALIAHAACARLYTAAHAACARMYIASCSACAPLAATCAAYASSQATISHPLPSPPPPPPPPPSHPPPPIHKHPKSRKRASQTLCTVHPSSLTPWTMDASALACRRESLCGGRLAVAGAPRRVASLIVKAHKVGVVPEALDRLDGVVVILGESVLRAARGATARKAS